MKDVKSYLGRLAAAVLVSLAAVTMPVSAASRATEPDYTYVEKDVSGWKAVYGPLLGKYSPQTKALPERESKSLDASDAAENMYAVLTDAKAGVYEGAYKLKKALILYDVLQGNYSKNAVGLLLDHGFFTDYYNDLKNAHLLPDGYKLPAKSYTVTVAAGETVDTVDDLGVVTTHNLIQTDSDYLEAIQLLNVAIASNDKAAVKVQRAVVDDFEDSYVPKARTLASR